MNKLYYFILFCFAALCFTACSDDDLEFSGIEGKDHYISDFALNVGGITYQATIAGDKITVEIPYNTDLKGATAAYTLSEGATINPNPSTIQIFADGCDLRNGNFFNDGTVNNKITDHSKQGG